MAKQSLQVIWCGPVPNDVRSQHLVHGNAIISLYWMNEPCSNYTSQLLTGLTLFQSGEFLSSLAFILADSSAFLHMTILSITSATGQLFIYYTIKEFGPVVFTIIMTTRQIFSLFVSCILYSHPLAALSWLSALFVFGVVFNRIYRKGTDWKEPSRRFLECSYVRFCSFFCFFVWKKVILITIC